MGEHWRDRRRLDDRVIAEVWETITSGRPDPRIHFAAGGPMVVVRPGTWATWDPGNEVPTWPAPPASAPPRWRR